MDIGDIIRNKGTERRAGIGKRGYLYTVAIVMMVVPLIFLLIFHMGTTQTRGDDLIGRIRCDELHYFVGDVERDLDRAMVIFGRRAAIYAIDSVVTENRTLDGYAYRNCTGFVFEGEGAEAAMAELMLCGTLYGENITYMENNTLPVWMERISARGVEYNFLAGMDVKGLAVVPYDAWSFATVLTMDISVEDTTGMCYYTDENSTVTSISSLVGLEDPLYPLQTNNQMVRYIDDCVQPVPLIEVKGEGIDGEGMGVGYAVFYSDIADLGAYCAGISDIGEKVLIIDQELDNCTPAELDCFNASSGDGVAGVVAYSSNSGFESGCSPTVPWVEGVFMEENISAGECIFVKNAEGCGMHQVLKGCVNRELGGCYRVSNVSEYPSTCSGEARDGPSFFDRLEGRLYLSDRYINQSLGYFGRSDIGLETLVDPYEILAHGLDADLDASWVDYMYWAGEEGEVVENACQNGSLEFRLDCRHAHMLDLDAGPANASGEAPNSSIVFPADNEVVPCGLIEIRGEAGDCDGDVERVDIMINGEQDEADWDGIRWTYRWSPAETGLYFIESRAVDDEGKVERDGGSIVAVSGCASGDNTPPGEVELTGPLDGEQVPRLDPKLYWEDAEDDSGDIFRYQVQISEAPGFESMDIVADAYVAGTKYRQADDLQAGRQYWWRVRAQDSSGNLGPWSAGSFTT